MLEDQVSFRYAISDRLRVGQVEDRLKQWHAQLGETSKTQIRPLTRYVSSSPMFAIGIGWEERKAPKYLFFRR